MTMSRHHAATDIYMGEGQAELALVEATLALAYEQRTANLIAAFSEGDLDNVGALRVERIALSDQIKVRLGIGHDARGWE